MPGERPPRWGWHCLTDVWAERLVERANIGAGDLVVDVGAGTGALTAPLVACGARVVAIELHPGRAAALRERFRDAPVVVVRADARDLRLPTRPFHVVANPPFAATTALVRRLVAPGSRLVSAQLVLPRFVVRRWCSAAAPASARWSHVFAARPGPEIPRSAFSPPPPGPVRCLELRRRASG